MRFINIKLANVTLQGETSNPPPDVTWPLPDGLTNLWLATEVNGTIDWTDSIGGKVIEFNQFLQSDQSIEIIPAGQDDKFIQQSIRFVSSSNGNALGTFLENLDLDESYTVIYIGYPRRSYASVPFNGYADILFSDNQTTGSTIGLNKIQYQNVMMRSVNADNGFNLAFDQQNSYYCMIAPFPAAGEWSGYTYNDSIFLDNATAGGTISVSNIFRTNGWSDYNYQLGAIAVYNNFVLAPESMEIIANYALNTWYGIFTPAPPAPAPEPPPVGFYLDSFNGNNETLADHISDSGAGYYDPVGYGGVVVLDNPANVTYSEVPPPPQSWNPEIQNPLATIGIYKSGSRLFATAYSPLATRSGIYYTDDGEGWTMPLRIATPFQGLNRNISDMIFSGNIGIVADCTGTGTIYRTTDNGDSWTSNIVNPNQINPSIYSQVHMCGDIAGGTVLAVFSNTDPANYNQFAYRSVNGGIDWNLTSLDIPTTNYKLRYLIQENNGTNYTNGTYLDVPLTNITGTGSGATADVTIVGGILFSAYINQPGSGYNAGDLLTIDSSIIGALGTGLDVLVGDSIMSDSITLTTGYSNYDGGYFWIFDLRNFIFYKSITSAGGTWTAYNIDFAINPELRYWDPSVSLGNGHGVNANNFIPIDDGTWLLSIPVEYVNYASDPNQTSTGFWRLKITTAATGTGLDNAGKLSGEQVTQGNGDEVSWTSYMISPVLETYGGTVEINGGLLFGNGIGYFLADLRVAVVSDGIENSSYAFTPTEWGTILNFLGPYQLGFDGDSTVFASYPIGNNHGPSYYNDNAFAVFTGSVTGDPPRAPIMYIDANTVDSGSMTEPPANFNTNYIWPWLATTDQAPNGNFFVEMTFAATDKSIGFSAGLSCGYDVLDTGFTVFIYPNNTGVNSHGQYNLELDVTDIHGNWNEIPPTEPYFTSTGIGLSGQYTLRIEVTNNAKTVTAFLDGDQITSFTIPISGIGLYEDSVGPPTSYPGGIYQNIPVTGGSGSGAEAWVQVHDNGNISDVAITDSGTGYVDGRYDGVPGIPLSGSSDILPSFYVTVAGGVVTGISVSSSGTGFVVGDTLTIDNRYLGGSGSGLLITVAQLFIYQDIIFTTAGSGYLQGDEVTLSGAYMGSVDGNDIVLTVAAPWDVADFTSMFQFQFYTKGASANTKLLELRGGVLPPDTPDPPGTVVVNGALDATGSIVANGHVLYKWIPDFSNSNLSISLVDPITNYDTILTLVDSDGVTILRQNDDYSGLKSQIDGLNIIAGTPYYIVVSAFGSEFGSFRLYTIYA
jgi:hypothetical protein